MLYSELDAILQAKNDDGASLTWEPIVVADASPSGTVLDMDPDPGTITVPDAHITITVSSGTASLALVSRWTSALHEAAAALPVGVPVLYAFLDFVDDPVYLNLSNVTFPWDGHDWLGTGMIGGVEMPDESSDLTAQAVKLTLSGVDSNLIGGATLTNYRGQEAVLYVAMHDPETIALVDEPEEFWRGLMSLMTLEADEGMGKITLTVEHWLRKTPGTTRQTDEEQRRLFPGDRFYQWLHTVRDTGKWGAKEVFFGSGGGHGGRNGDGHRQHV